MPSLKQNESTDSVILEKSISSSDIGEMSCSSDDDILTT